MKMLSSEQVQELLHISRPTLYLWVRQGKLAAKRAGRRLLFAEGEVLALLQPRVPAAAKVAEDAADYEVDRKIEEILSLRFNTGETDVAARHEEIDP